MRGSRGVGGGDCLGAWVEYEPGVQVAPAGVAAGVPVVRKTPATAPTSRGAEFVTVSLPAASPTILVEIRRGATSVAVHWPLSAAGACAAWLGTWLR